MSHGLQLLATYTYSKVIDDASDVLAVDLSEIGISHSRGNRRLHMASHSEQMRQPRPSKGRPETPASIAELAVESAHYNTLTQNVAIDRFQDIRPRSVGTKIEFRIESKKFKCVVVMRARGRCARSHIAHAAPAILRLNCAIR
jgi:hypothetical protein